MHRGKLVSVEKHVRGDRERGAAEAGLSRAAGDERAHESGPAVCFSFTFRSVCVLFCLFCSLSTLRIKKPGSRSLFVHACSTTTVYCSFTPWHRTHLWFFRHFCRERLSDACTIVVTETAPACVCSEEICFICSRLYWNRDAATNCLHHLPRQPRLQRNGSQLAAVPSISRLTLCLGTLCLAHYRPVLNLLCLLLPPIPPINCVD